MTKANGRFRIFRAKLEPVVNTRKKRVPSLIFFKKAREIDSLPGKSWNFVIYYKNVKKLD